MSKFMNAGARPFTWYVAPLTGMEPSRVGAAARSSAGRDRRHKVIEFVGLAGVGKSHLNRRLVAWYGSRALDLDAVAPRRLGLGAWWHALSVVVPVFAPVLAAGPAPARKRWRFLRQALALAAREAWARRYLTSDVVVLSEEGWFHKLREFRRLTGSDTSFADLAVAARARLFYADLVILLTAEPEVVCARKLRRRGIEVTPESVARQYAASRALGQWDEHRKSVRDLEEAATKATCDFQVIDYRPGFDVVAELVPLLEARGLD